MKGVHQHCDECRLAEFASRFNTRTSLGVDDGGRTTNMLKGISGKRLTSRRMNEGAPE